MPFFQPDVIRYYQFDSLNEKGLVHAIFTRQGGVSPVPWRALNMGGSVGDDPTRVLKNRQRAFETLNRPIDSMFDVWQVHSAEVVCASSPSNATISHTKADAILTDRCEVTLFMRFADCVPIFLYDGVRRVVGLVHAGWQGTIHGTVGSAISVMKWKYGSRPGDIIAALGPSIAAHHYPVGPEVEARVRNVFNQDATALLPIRDGRVQFDLWAANNLILEQSGVSRIEIAGICTACHIDDWYSHRGESDKTGRFGALIGLKGN